MYMGLYRSHTDCMKPLSQTPKEILLNLCAGF